MAPRAESSASRLCVGLTAALLCVWCDRGPLPPDPQQLTNVDPRVLELVTELTGEVNASRSDAARWEKLAMAYEANGLLLEAERTYDVAIALRPQDPRPRYRVALLRWRRGESDAALADLNRAIELAPGYAPARWRLGQWELDRGRFDDARAAFKAAVSAAPTDPAGSVGLALVHMAQREDQAAADLLESVVKARPGERYALYLLGTAYGRLGREDEARTALVVGSSGQPSWSDPWADEVAQYRRGFAAQLKEATALGLERRYDEAIAILKRLTEERPDDRALRTYLGGIYASAGRVTDAVATLDPILAADPDSFDAHLHLASAYLFAGALDMAAPHASRALALRPESAEASKLQGVVSWQQGNLREAEAAFDRARQADPRDPMPMLWTGMILGQQGRYGDARRAFEQALEKNPLLGDALIGLADTYAATGNFSRALEVLARVDQADPGNPRLPAAKERITSAARAAR